MTKPLTFLGIDVSDDLFEGWVDWVAPVRQPFLVDVDSQLGSLSSASELTPPELVDTYGFYGVPKHLTLAMLDQSTFSALPRAARSALVRGQALNRRSLVPSVRAWRGKVGSATSDQADGHRFVWWPDLLRGHEVDVLTAFVTADPGTGRRRFASRHREVPTGVWKGVERLVPGAKEIAGRFPLHSGPNCFGTVMAAAGIEDVGDTWMPREPFEDFLSSRTVPGGRDSAPGTVFVWRWADGRAQHAAITLGDGWALHKPSQSWASPVKILTTQEVKRISRDRGLHLERHTMIAR